VETEGTKPEPIETLRHRVAHTWMGGSEECVRGVRVKSRVKVRAGKPWKGRNPGEHPAVRRAKHTFGRKGLSRRVEAQKPQSAVTGRCFGIGGIGGRNGTWVHPGGNVRIPGERGTLRRVNPRSAAGTK